MKSSDDGIMPPRNGSLWMYGQDTLFRVTRIQQMENYAFTLLELEVVRGSRDSLLYSQVYLKNRFGPYSFKVVDAFIRGDDIQVLGFVSIDQV